VYLGFDEGLIDYVERAIVQAELRITKQLMVTEDHTASRRLLVDAYNSLPVLQQTLDTLWLIRSAFYRRLAHQEAVADAECGQPPTHDVCPAVHR
jgi:hypothetical protein